MPAHPIYLGVTGITSRDQAEHLVYSPPPSRIWQIMIGVLASRKTLDGQHNKYPRRYPPVEQISDIFVNNIFALNLIHYSTDDTGSLLSQLDRLSDLGGPYLNGFQLNITWPDPRALEAYRKQHASDFIVLQVGKECMASVSYSPRALAEKLRDEYAGLCDYVLLDASGGCGVALEIPVLRSYIAELRERFETVGIGVAGGLSAETIDSVKGLRDLVWPVCVDAEGRLRDERSDELDLAKVDAYLRRGFRILG